jgi:DNA-binding response OmpR family regulator
MKATQLNHVREVLQSPTLHLHQSANQVEGILKILDEEPSSEAGSHRGRDLHRHSDLVDPTTFTARWGRKTCHLGYTIPYRVLEVLARHPNRYVSHEQLLDEAWGGPRSDSAVRSAVADLRARLNRAGLNRLALAIDGRNSGHYALLLSAAESDVSH